jgi:hypothetical protein
MMAKRQPKRRPKAKPACKPKPKPRAAPHLWHKAFLAALAQHGNKTLAAEQAGIDRKSIYLARELDAAFKQAWDEALDQAADRLEAEAFRRAHDGWEEPVFGSMGAGLGSGEVGSIRRFDSTLLIFLLKGARPDKFRERHQVSHDGAIGNVVFYLPDNGRSPAATGAAGAIPRNAG